MVDETGDVNKARTRSESNASTPARPGGNAHVAVNLVYAGGRGHAVVDRELYVPRSWTSDPDRCRHAGLGHDTGFATEPDGASGPKPQEE